MRKHISTCVLLAGLAAGNACLWGAEPVDLKMVQRIRDEASRNSQVMEHLFWLTDANGPRLTNSTGYDRAAQWAVKKLQSWGIDGAKLESWGTFGRGWEVTKFSAHMTAPYYAPLVGFPRAWTRGTQGVANGTPVIATLGAGDEFPKWAEKWKGKLKGKVVLLEPPREIALNERSNYRRFSAEELAAMESTDLDRPVRGGERGGFNRSAFALRREQIVKFLNDEGVLLVVTPALLGDGGTVFASSFGSQDLKSALPPPAVALTPEHYNRLYRLVEKGVPVTLESNVQVKISEDKPEAFNVIAEIPGTDKKDEVVMLGAHLDSWHGGTGATDNAAGSAVMLEAMRILRALNVQPRRTIRLALWSGEEQGLFGSRGYADKHFVNRQEAKVLPEQAKISAYYNVDNGTGRIRGVYLQNNDMVAPIFQAWIEPFKDLGVTTLSPRRTGGTDHLSFDGVGIPGFQFIQDPVEYDSRTHHSNMDVLDRIVPDDMRQAAALVASFVYHTAMRDEMMPRKPMPKLVPVPPAETAPANDNKETLKPATTSAGAGK